MEKDADEANAKIKMGNLNDAEVDKLKAAAKQPRSRRPRRQPATTRKLAGI